MKIKKFTKAKNSMYLLTLVNEDKVRIHQDLILKYGLLLSKELSFELLEEIQNENKLYEIYDIALRYINTRLRSRKELRKYLIKKGYSEDSINNVINMLSNQGYLNDEIYANSYVHDRMLMSSYGPNRIRGDLEKLGISNEFIDSAISIFTIEKEKERIEKLVAKQIKSNHNKGPLVLKKKIQTYLLNLGYSINLINEALNKKNLMTESIYRKEYDKLYSKLSKKYSGKELEYKLKQKMYQKGFSNIDFE